MVGLLSDEAVSFKLHVSDQILMETAYFSSWIIQKCNQTDNDTKQKGSY